MRNSLLTSSIAVGLLGGIMLNFPRTVSSKDGLRLDVLDVGQGDAILLSTAEARILIDGGSDASVLEQLGAVRPLWDRDLDLIVLTHPHEDHLAGLVPVLERFDVESVLLSGPDYPSEAYGAFLGELKTGGITIYFAHADKDFQFGELTLDVLYPFESLAGLEMENVNNSSVVVRAVYGEHAVLLTGDAESEVEQQLLAARERDEIELESEVLKAGHHGSISSTSLDFLRAVSPETLIISCGEGNDYGHPHAATLEKTEDEGISVLRTDLDGRVTMFFN